MEACTHISITILDSPRGQTYVLVVKRFTPVEQYKKFREIFMQNLFGYGSFPELGFVN